MFNNLFKKFKGEKSVEVPFKKNVSYTSKAVDGLSNKNHLTAFTWGLVKEACNTKFWDSDTKVSRYYGVSTTTVFLIRKSKSFEHYKELRRKHSKPKKYT